MGGEAHSLELPQRETHTYLLVRTPRGAQHSLICKVGVKGRNEGEEKLWGLRHSWKPQTQASPINRERGMF